MAPATEELIKLVEDLPEEERDELISELRVRAEIRARGAITLSGIQAHVTGHVSPPLLDDSDEATARGRDERRPGALGPAGMGAAVMLGWVAGAVGGPVFAIVGALAGLLLGNLLDRHANASAGA